MREILFRGKRIDNGEWVEGYLVPITINCYDKGYEIIESDGIEYDELDGYNPLFSSFRVYPETVGQYTGLTDRNGKQIFEGDILDVSGSPDADLLGYRDGLAIVRWNEDVSGFAPFACYDSDCGLYVFEKECEVIGNIHDNPELIGGKEDATV